MSRVDSKTELAIFEKAIAELEEETTEQEESFVDDDGTQYVWNAELKKYQPQEMVKEYDQETMTFHGIEEDSAPTLEDALKKEEVHGKDDLKRKQMDAAHWSDPKKTTSVYVTGLPVDVTVEEVARVFSKCGVLKEDEESGVKIKIYKDKETGMPKGDGLVTYLKRPSVELAIQILSGTPLRDNMTQKMTIQEAKFEMKDKPQASKKRQQTKKKKVAKREDKVLGWGGFDDHLALHQITVIMKHLFDPKELKDGEMTEGELKLDVEKECAKLGEVDRVIVYPEHSEGVVSIRFTSEDAADACVDLMNGRFFAGKQVQAAKWDGFTKYHVPIEKKVDEGGDEVERLERFAQDLEKSEG